MREKNLSIESLRAVAILLVVVGHVIGSDSMGGMKIAYPSFWRYLYSLINYIQMPLFSAIAGWVYGLNPTYKIGLSEFMFNKFKRLIIPMATVGTLYFLIQYLIPGTNNKGDLEAIWRIYLFPYTVFWYLQSLFLIFFVAIIAEKLSLLKEFKSWIYMLIVAFILYIVQIVFVAGNVENYFSFQGMMNQLIYFMIGVGIVRFSKELDHYLKFTFALAIVGICLLQVVWFYPNLREQLYICLLPIWLFGTLQIIMNLKIKNRVLIYIGSYTYSIYLFHAFGTAGGRIILSRLGVHSELLIFLFATLIAVIFPVLVDKILSHNRYTRMIFLGKSK